MEPKPSRQRGLVKHVLDTIDTRFSYISLLVCCFISGLVDSNLFNAYGTFVSMQTGNTIFVGLGTAAQLSHSNEWAMPLCSIGFFVLGAIFWSRLHRWLGGQRRGTLFLSFFLQAAFIIISASVIQGGLLYDSSQKETISSERQFHSLELIPVALLSFQAAGQIVNSRNLNCGEVPTVVITSLLCDLMSDPGLFDFSWENAKRNRRFTAFVLTLVGAICGAWIYEATSEIHPSLWLAAGLKVVISLSWLLWEAKE